MESEGALASDRMFSANFLAPMELRENWMQLFLDERVVFGAALDVERTFNCNCFAFDVGASDVSTGSVMPSKKKSSPGSAAEKAVSRGSSARFHCSP